MKFRKKFGRNEKEKPPATLRGRLIKKEPLPKIRRMGIRCSLVPWANDGLYPGKDDYSRFPGQGKSRGSSDGTDDISRIHDESPSPLDNRPLSPCSGGFPFNAGVFRTSAVTSHIPKRAGRLAHNKNGEIDWRNPSVTADLQHKTIDGFYLLPGQQGEFF